jgi:hypothetical protein
MGDEVPDALCPACGEWVPDHDGFGVLAHLGPGYANPCGYCSHPSIDSGVCGICQLVVDELTAIDSTGEKETAK